MTLYPIPFDFIENNVFLSWCEIRWGYENNIISADVAIKKAEKTVLTESYTESELELSFIYNPEFKLSFLLSGETEDVTCLLKSLCPNINQDDEPAIKRKWLYVVLKWLWSRRFTFENPLAEIEIIYADFDYPVEIENFVGYMPPQNGYNPDAHSYEENIHHLMDNWEQYLKRESAIFAGKTISEFCHLKIGRN